MAAPSLNDLETLLSDLNKLKPPGASKNKIGAITQLSIVHIQEEQHITQCLYRALKKAPATHKLGALYVIDSVVRRWIDQAKKEGQDLNIEGRGESGTYPAAVKRITELMPALFDDILKALPSDQRSKLENMIGIWERGQTFPAKLLQDFKSKLSTPQSVPHVNGNGTTNGVDHGKRSSGEKFVPPIATRPPMTPVGYPPQHLWEQGFIVRKGEPMRPHDAGSAQQVAAPSQQAPQAAPPTQTPAPAGQDVNSILAALANAAPKATPQPPPQPTMPPANPQPQLPPQLAAMFGNPNSFQSNQALPPQMPAPYGAPPSHPLPFLPPGFQPPPGFPGFPPQPPPSVPQHYAQAPPPPQPAADPLAPLRSILPQNIVNDQAKLMQALNLLQDLQNGGLPMEQWGPIIQAFAEQSSPQQPAPQQFGGYDGYNRARDRSRSPDRGHGGVRRGSPVYGSYDGPQQDDQRNGGNNKGRYRQRSPIRDSPGYMPMPTNLGMPSKPKFVAFDNTLKGDHIRVLSRTLFIGGANGSQQEIHDLFGRFGQVASCIPNREKRHAFVKMTTREHTLNAKAGVEALQAANDRDTMAVARQTKWGVGFGPRECFDYGKGESVIPISRLTDADMKWMTTAEYGGTGGRPLETGMVLEEPDIEIGAGVSSKAMSKRVIPDTSGHNAGGNHAGGQHGGGGHGGGGQGGGQRFGGKGKKDRRNYHVNRDDVGGGPGYGAIPQGGYGQVVRPEPVAVATPPAVPGFGFSLPGAR